MELSASKFHRRSGQDYDSYLLKWKRRCHTSTSPFPLHRFSIDSSTCLPDGCNHRCMTTRLQRNDKCRAGAFIISTTASYSPQFSTVDSHKACNTVRSGKDLHNLAPDVMAVFYRITVSSLHFPVLEASNWSTWSTMPKRHFRGSKAQNKERQRLLARGVVFRKN